MCKLDKILLKENSIERSFLIDAHLISQNWSFSLHFLINNNSVIYMIIINSYILVISIKLTHKKLYAMCVEWTKLSEIENRSLSIRLLHAVETIKLRLCIKFVRNDCTLENECSCHSKLLQQLCFHHHSRCCLEILRNWDDDLIVREVNVL